jgi:hypothetical protein
MPQPMEAPRSMAFNDLRKTNKRHKGAIGLRGLEN